MERRYLYWNINSLQKNSGFIGVLLMLFLLGCTKGGGNVYIEGYVKNPVTGEGYADIKINLSKIQKTSLPGGYKTVKTVYTDENGYFEISHTGLTDYWARVEVDNDLYYGLGWANNNSGGAGIYSISIDKGQNMYADYEMVPFGEWKFDIKNINCQGSNDNIKIIYEGAQVEDEDFRVGDVIINLDGCIDILGDVWRKNTMGNRYYRWEVTKNGTTNTFHDTIYLSEGEQRIYEINY